MPRSIKKGPFVDYYLIEKIEKMDKSGKKAPIKTWSRRSMVAEGYVHVVAVADLADCRFAGEIDETDFTAGELDLRIIAVFGTEQRNLSCGADHLGAASGNELDESRRYITVLDYSELTRTAPQKSLTKGKKSTGGRNSAGRITTRFRGNGNKRRYRMIDFKRTKEGVPAVVQQIEYDPNRSA